MCPRIQGHMEMMYVLVLSKVMQVLTYINMKLWLSDHMKFVIVQVSKSYRLIDDVWWICLWFLISTCVNCVTIILCEDIARSVWCCLLSPKMTVVCKGEKSECHLFCLSNHYMRQEVKHYGGCLVTPIPLEAAHKAMICAAGQASPWFDWYWSLVWYSYMGFKWRHTGWLTLDAKQ